MSEIDKDLETLARREWPSFAKSASVLSDGTGAHPDHVLYDGSGLYYYESPETGKYTYPQYLYARHVLGLDDAVEEETNMHPDLEWLARNVIEWGVADGTYDRILKYHGDVDFCQSAGCDKDGRFRGFQSFSRTQWLQARQDLGLVRTEEEAELPAKEYKRTAESFLRQAAELMKERGKQYDQDDGERSMGKTVDAFNAITGRDLSESEGWLLMGLLKSVRQYSGGYHRDSAEDKVAYAALEAESLEASALRARELGE